MVHLTLQEHLRLECLNLIECIIYWVIIICFNEWRSYKKRDGFFLNNFHIRSNFSVSYLSYVFGIHLVLGLFDLKLLGFGEMYVSPINVSNKDMSFSITFLWNVLCNLTISVNFFFKCYNRRLPSSLYICDRLVNEFFYTFVEHYKCIHTTSLLWFNNYC